MKYFVRNNTGKHIVELKPGIGEFRIPAGAELEISNFIDVVTTPTKKELSYVRYTAKEIATSLVGDFGVSGALELIERE